MLWLHPGCSRSIYNGQALTNADALKDLDDAIGSKICNTVRKTYGTAHGHVVALIAVSRMKLVVYYMKHQLRISRNIPGLHKVDKAMIDNIKAQKTL